MPVEPVQVLHAARLLLDLLLTHLRYFVKCSITLRPQALFRAGITCRSHYGSVELQTMCTFTVFRKNNLRKVCVRFRRQNVRPKTKYFPCTMGAPNPIPPPPPSFALHACLALCRCHPSQLSSGATRRDRVSFHTQTVSALSCDGLAGCSSGGRSSGGRKGRG